ncbi:MAG: hypothetical protein ACK5NA_04455 [Enterococcus sp.]
MIKRWILSLLLDPKPRIDPYEVDNEFTLATDFPDKDHLKHE